MNDDKKLLELAAKAAGIEVFEGHPSSDEHRHGHLYLKQDKVMYTAKEWNPLTIDGDALRLAVKLGFEVRYRQAFNDVRVSMFNGSAWINDLKQHGGDNPYAATRRAIVRAAAAMATELEKQK